eukprot:5803897-Prymnesium_polylepis.1
MPAQLGVPIVRRVRRQRLAARRPRLRRACSDGRRCAAQHQRGARRAAAASVAKAPAVARLVAGRPCRRRRLSPRGRARRRAPSAAAFPPPLPALRRAMRGRRVAAVAAGALVFGEHRDRGGGVGTEPAHAHRRHAELAPRVGRRLNRRRARGAVRVVHDLELALVAAIAPRDAVVGDGARAVRLRRRPPQLDGARADRVHPRPACGARQRPVL